MKKLTRRDYEEVRIWIYQNARPLDQSLWKYHFEEGSPQNVVEILSLYQNEDGGFGKGLEPDSWARESTPYTTSFAIDILEEIQQLSSESPLVNSILVYLEGSFDEQLGMWPFTLPFNDKYPHAPWWSYNEDENKIQSLGLTLLKWTLCQRHYKKTKQLKVDLYI